MSGAPHGTFILVCVLFCPVARSWSRAAFPPLYLPCMLVYISVFCCSFVVAQPYLHYRWCEPRSGCRNVSHISHLPCISVLFFGFPPCLHYLSGAFAKKSLAYLSTSLDLRVFVAVISLNAYPSPVSPAQKPWGAWQALSQEERPPQEDRR